MGLLSGAIGTLEFDPENPNAAKVSVDVPIATIHTTIAGLDEEFLGKMFFDAEQFSNAHFESSKVTVDGTSAVIEGDLTIHDETKPATINAKFAAAGTNPFTKAETVGFTGSTTIKRSDFGLGAYAPMVSDEVKLHITVAFEKH